MQDPIKNSITQKPPNNQQPSTPTKPQPPILDPLPSPIPKTPQLSTNILPQSIQPTPKKLSKTLTNFRSSSLVNLGRGSLNSNGKGDGSSHGSKNVIVRNTVTGQQQRHDRSNSDRKLSVRNKLEQNSGENGSQIKNTTNKSRSTHKSLKQPQITPFTLNPKKPIPDQITEYIAKRRDVQIVHHFQSYKKQFYTKSKILHDYIQSCEQPEKIRNTYLNESDSHFRNGLQAIMLRLYRSGVIVPDSYTNLRQDAVDQIQKWVIGWLHRKIMYGKLAEDQDNQVAMVEDSLKYLDQYRKQINSQDTSF